MSIVPLALLGIGSYYLLSLNQKKPASSLGDAGFKIIDCKKIIITNKHKTENYFYNLGKQSIFSWKKFLGECKISSLEMTTENYDIIYNIFLRSFAKGALFINHNTSLNILWLIGLLYISFDVILRKNILDVKLTKPFDIDFVDKKFSYRGYKIENKKLIVYDLPKAEEFFENFGKTSTIVNPYLETFSLMSDEDSLNLLVAVFDILLFGTLEGSEISYNYKDEYMLTRAFMKGLVFSNKLTIEEVNKSLSSLRNTYKGEGLDIKDLPEVI